jgi:uncharacterized membrane protein
MQSLQLSDVHRHRHRFRSGAAVMIAAATGLAAPAEAAAQGTDAAAAPVEWSPLLAFVYAVVVALFVVLVIYAIWSVRSNASERGPLTSLKGLDASWSFSDSWLSNVTAASGLLVAVAGSSDFLKSVLGDKADAVVGVATVAGLIVTGLVGAAGVLVLAVRKPEATEVSIGGLVLGTAVALGAAGGQVWALLWLLDAVDLGAAGHWILLGAAVFATLLLLVYACTSIIGFLTHGTEADPVTDSFALPPSAELAAVAVAVAGLGEPANVTRARIDQVVNGLKPATGDTQETQAPALLAFAPRPLSSRAALP